MNNIIAFIKRHPLATFFFLAYAFSWTMVALLKVSFAFALLALFGPALAAILVSAVTEGRAGVRELLRRVILWRFGIAWYVAAIGLPLLVAISVLLAYARFTGTPFAPGTETPIALTLVLAILVVGEEIGWRGFALPHLQKRYNGLAASLILGVLWAGWHLANGTIPGLQAYWYGFPAFLFFVVSQTVLFTWLVNNARNSVLIAWIFHASINVTGEYFFTGDQVTQWWLSGLGFTIIAVIVVLVNGLNLVRQPAVVV